MSFSVVIPARYASSRLPGKPLLDIAGKTMIERVYQQACKSNASQVIVATDDERIADVVKQFGGEVCITGSHHQSGTDRLQEVAAYYGWDDDHRVVNVQGDEPLMPPEVINQVADNLENKPAGVATLCEPITKDGIFFDPNAVKVLTDQRGIALYFSRAPIPWPRDIAASQDDSSQANTGPSQVAQMQAIYQPMRHIGIYGYRVGLLNKFVQWPVAPLEQLESLEQLRFLWQGEFIHVAQAIADVPGGVDTQEDLLRVTAEITASQ